MDSKVDIAIIGECLIELSANGTLADTSTLNKYFGGDTVTTAVAIARLGGNVTYVTKVGNDGFSEFILSSLRKEGIDTSLIKTGDEQNGMYIVSRTPEKNELLYYKRKTAAAKLSIEDLPEDCIKKLKLIYSTGVVQSLSACSRELVREAFKIAKENGIKTAYDPNYHSALTTVDDAKDAFFRLASNIDILFMNTKSDSTNILEIDSHENAIKKLWDMGISTVVLKSSEKNGYYTGYNGKIVFTEFYTSDYVDTTCSGDTFNGGFLHAYTHGFTPLEATKFASIVAGLQAKGIGAIKSIPYRDEVYSIYRGYNG